MEGVHLYLPVSIKTGENRVGLQADYVTPTIDVVRLGVVIYQFVYTTC
jgi:hypothetical protein